MTWQPWHDDLQRALAALRPLSEAKWRALDEPAFDPDAGVGGFSWSPSTRWLPGLDDARIDALSARHGFAVPSDYRAYLRALHGTTPRRPGATFGDDVRLTNASLIPATAAGFYSWENDVADIAQAREQVIQGLLFDVANNGLWLAEWGSRADDIAVLEQQLRAHVHDAAPLLPLFGHRHLLVLDDSGPNPVLSIHGSDVIVYGADLLAYLREELRLDGPAHPPSMPMRAHDLKHLPLWGALLFPR